jgi:hypothetical protein
VVSRATEIIDSLAFVVDRVCQPVRHPRAADGEHVLQPLTQRRRCVGIRVVELAPFSASVEG